MTRSIFRTTLAGAFLSALLLAASVLSSSPRALAADATPVMKDVWFYVSSGLRTDADVENIVSLIERASAVDLNGMLWAASWDGAHTWSPEVIARLEKVKAAADKGKIEIIPILWSVGYGTMTGFDPNLAEGLLVEDLPMTVHGDRALFEPEDVSIPNGDMETWNGDQLTIDGFHDRPGAVSFRDDATVHGGATSLRFENLETQEHGHGRIMYRVDLTPGRVYRATVWGKGENLLGDVVIQAYNGNGSGVATGSIRVPREKDGSATFDWTKMHVLFQAPEDGKMMLYAGIWRGKRGTMWLDDYEIEPLGLVNPLQRAGTPITVKSADGKTIYEQGKDWALPKFTVQPWKPDAESQPILLTEGSAIKDGEKLAVDFYYPPLVGAPQIGTCMSEPELYEYFEKSAEAVAKILNPQKWFLSMDEIRCAGTCKACKDRGISLAAILADCIEKQRAIIKDVRPDADVYIWSDMLDPNHNAHADYYVCDGDYTGVWDLVPKDLIISCWYYDKRELSMKFFSERGFRTHGAAYYDTDDLKSCEDWFDVCKRTPNCVGIMYTTWERKYELLEDFGKLVAPKKASGKPISQPGRSSRSSRSSKR